MVQVRGKTARSDSGSWRGFLLLRRQKRLPSKVTIEMNEWEKNSRKWGRGGGKKKEDILESSSHRASGNDVSFFDVWFFSITTKGFPPRGKRRRGCVYCALEPLLSTIYCAHTILMCVSFERRKRVCNTCVCNGIAGFRSFPPILFFFREREFTFPESWNIFFNLLTGLPITCKISLIFR